MKRGVRAVDAIRDRRLYDEYLRRLDVRAVLNHYGVENDFEEPGREGSTEIRHSCLLDRVERHHNNGDANPSASANIERKKYLCRAFWGGDMFQFIAKMEDKSDFSGILPLVRDFLNGTTTDRDTFHDEVERLIEASTTFGILNENLQGYNDRIIRPWAFVHPYLAERGIDFDTASRLQIGWREDLNRITIPVFWKGVLVGWQGRAIPDRPGQWPGTWGGDIPKYKSSPGLPRSSVLYTSDPQGRVTGGDSVIVVESPFSVIKAAALGVEQTVVATFGAKVSVHQVDLLGDFRHVIVWADDDEAGRQMERRLVRDLHRRVAVSVVEPDEGMDLGDYDEAESVMSKVSSAIPAVMKQMEWGAV